MVTAKDSVARKNMRAKSKLILDVRGGASSHARDTYIKPIISLKSLL